MVKGKTAKSKKSEREGSDCLLPRPSECVRIRGVEIKRRTIRTNISFFVLSEEKEDEAQTWKS